MGEAKWRAASGWRGFSPIWSQNLQFANPPSGTFQFWLELQLDVTIRGLSGFANLLKSNSMRNGLVGSKLPQHREEKIVLHEEKVEQVVEGQGGSQGPDR